MVRAAFKEKKLWLNTILEYINQQSNIQGVHVEAIISYWQKIKVIIIYTVEFFTTYMHHLHCKYISRENFINLNT